MESVSIMKDKEINGGKIRKQIGGDKGIQTLNTNVLFWIGSWNIKRTLGENCWDFKVSGLVNSIVPLLISWFWSSYYDYIVVNIRGRSVKSICVLYTISQISVSLNFFKIKTWHAWIPFHSYLKCQQTIIFPSSWFCQTSCYLIPSEMFLCSP